MKRPTNLPDHLQERMLKHLSPKNVGHYSLSSTSGRSVGERVLREYDARIEDKARRIERSLYWVKKFVDAIRDLYRTQSRATRRSKELLSNWVKEQFSIFQPFIPEATLEIEHGGEEEVIFAIVIPHDDWKIRANFLFEIESGGYPVAFGRLHTSFTGPSLQWKVYAGSRLVDTTRHGEKVTLKDVRSDPRTRMEWEIGTRVVRNSNWM